MCEEQRWANLCRTAQNRPDRHGFAAWYYDHNGQRRCTLQVVQSHDEPETVHDDPKGGQGNTLLRHMLRRDLICVKAEQSIAVKYASMSYEEGHEYMDAVHPEQRDGLQHPDLEEHPDLSGAFSEIDAADVVDSPE